MTFWLKSRLNESDRRQINFRIHEIEDELDKVQSDDEFASLDAERYELMRMLGES